MHQFTNFVTLNGFPWINLTKYIFSCAFIWYLSGSTFSSQKIINICPILEMVKLILPTHFPTLDKFYHDANIFPVCTHLADAGTPAAPFPANRLSTVVQYLRWPNLSSPLTWVQVWNQFISLSRSDIKSNPPYQDWLSPVVLVCIVILHWPQLSLQGVIDYSCS